MYKKNVQINNVETITLLVITLLFSKCQLVGKN